MFLIPGMCDYVMLHGKGEFRSADTKIDYTGLSGWAQYNHKHY